MISIRDIFVPIGAFICALCFFAPNAVANYSMERWLRADVSRRKWKRMFVNLTMKPWYPTFVRIYGLVGLVFLLIYLVFFRFSK